MNRARWAGICRQLAGSLNQFWGQGLGDPSRAAAGRRQQIVGKAQQVSAIAQEQAERQLQDFWRHHRNWYL